MLASFEPLIAHVVVDVDEAQFVLSDNSGALRVRAPADNGLLAFSDEIVSVLCGAHWGTAAVRVEGHPRQPETDLHGWDDVAEFGLTTREGLSVGSLFGPAVAAPPLEAARGELRVQVCARGRRASRDAFRYDQPSGPLAETYLIRLWPAKLTAPVVLRGAEHEEEEVAPSSSSEELAGQGAVKRIAATVSAGTLHDTLSGQLGTVTLSAEVSVKKAKALRMLTALYGWWGSYGPPASHEPGASYRFDFGGEVVVVGTYLQLVPGRSVTCAWQWRTSRTPGISSRPVDEDLLGGL